MQRGLETGHTSFIHCLSYDFYGKRLATCSADQTIKIWKVLSNGDWVCENSCEGMINIHFIQSKRHFWAHTVSIVIKAHSAAVSKLCWAHPEFGQILASGSADKKVIIWVENKSLLFMILYNIRCKIIIKNEGKWEKKIELTDFMDTVTDLKFAPRQHGLKIAACSLDGFVRIYEAMDVINLEQWSVIVR